MKSSRYGEHTPIQLLPSFRRPGYFEMVEDGSLYSDDHKWETAEAVLLWTSDKILARGTTIPVFKYISQILLLDNDCSSLDMLIDQRHIASYMRKLRLVIKKNNEKEKHDITVYRGLRVSKEQAKHYEEERYFLWPNFSATSRMKEVAQDFAGETGYVFEIELNRSVMMYSIPKKLTKFKSENEVLLHPYSGFEVLYVDHKRREIGLRAKDFREIEKIQRKKIPSKLLLWNPIKNEVVQLTKNKKKDTTLVKRMCVEQDEKVWTSDCFEDGYWDSPTKFVLTISDFRRFFRNTLDKRHGRGWWQFERWTKKLDGSLARDVSEDWFDVTSTLNRNETAIDEEKFKDATAPFKKSEILEKRKLNDGSNSFVSVNDGSNSFVSVNGGSNSFVSVNDGSNSFVSVNGGSNSFVSVNDGSNSFMPVLVFVCVVIFFLVVLSG
eukprot:TRINITY_DN40_c0_g1_i1.p1 TRINITY_DN40_c0_g1~~TRINITY_DN40_c0_g1_i1.p1  ORF type:complete len:437 (-),score=101.26 TRINITY_DN40_c0_g1_i1:24-1334(-)